MRNRLRRIHCFVAHKPCWFVRHNHVRYPLSRRIVD